MSMSSIDKAQDLSGSLMLFYWASEYGGTSSAECIIILHIGLGSHYYYIIILPMQPVEYVSAYHDACHHNVECTWLNTEIHCTI